MGQEKGYLENVILSSIRVYDEKIDYPIGSDAVMRSRVEMLISDKKDELPSETLLASQDVDTPYKRVHMYCCNDGPRKKIYLFKNSDPTHSCAEHQESKDDKFDTFLRKSIAGLLKTVEEKIHNTSMYTATYIIKTPFFDGLEDKMEYILPNARTNKNGKQVCWHIYTKKELDHMNLYIFEHISPVYNKVVEYKLPGEQDLEYLDVTMDKTKKDDPSDEML